MNTVLPVMATTAEEQTLNTDENKETEVTFVQSSSYLVTIPKVITLDSNKESTYSVKVEGDISSENKVSVRPTSTVVAMKDQTTRGTPKADVEAIITHTKDTWNFQDAANGVESVDNHIEGSNLSAGNWKGTFNFEINLTSALGRIEYDTSMPTYESS